MGAFTILCIIAGNVLGVCAATIMKRDGYYTHAALCYVASVLFTMYMVTLI